MKTKRDLSMNLWGTDVVVPAETVVIEVRRRDGGGNRCFAVRDIKLLVKLTGNTHDPKYRYAFIDQAEIDGA